MTGVKIENIIAYAQIADELDIGELAGKKPDFSYNPNEFSGLTLKLDDLKTAALLLPNGKVVCTGAKTMEAVEDTIKTTYLKLKDVGAKVRRKTSITIQNVIASTDLNKELHLSSISQGLVLEHADYEPEQFPGLIYKMDDIGAILLIFSSGKIVCTGTKSLDDASKAIELMKEKLSALGAL